MNTSGGSFVRRESQDTQSCIPFPTAFVGLGNNKLEKMLAMPGCIFSRITGQSDNYVQDSFLELK